MLLWLLLALGALIQTFVISALLTPLARREATPLGLIDKPNLARKQHAAPIPRSGGLAIFVAFWGCFWMNFFVAGLVLPHLGFLPESVRALAGNVMIKSTEVLGLFIGASMIFLIGFLDDRFNLPAKLRLFVQILACVPLLYSGIVLELFLPPVVSWPLTIIWVVFLTNSLNFLDNMNGLTSGVSTLIAIIMGVISLLSGEWFMAFVFFLLAGAIAGFWLYNFPKASIFLGDCGSTHIGYLLACLSILATYYQQGVPSKLPILIPLVVLGIPLFDTLSVMWIRFRSGRPLMEGDTNHISHRLVSLGLSRTEAVLFIYLCVIVLGLLAMGLRNLDWLHGIFQTVAIALIFFLLHWLERVGSRRGV